MLKRMHDILFVNTINLSALILAENVPAITLAENYMKILVLLATFIYTVIKIMIELRKYKKSKQIETNGEQSE